MGRFENETALLDKAEIQSALNVFAEALECIGFYKGKDGKRDPIMKITEAFFKRAGMFPYESQMIKGVSARVIQKLSAKKN
jgi:tRNA C32,U32 (ribose-2'-O)-methylase TrmJ